MNTNTYQELQRIDKEAQKFNCNKIADRILLAHGIICSAGDFYEYNDGFYKLIKNTELKKYIKDILKEEYSSYKANEILHSIEAEVFVRPEELNKTEYLNLKNGLFDIRTGKLVSHSSEVLSTIRLAVAYNETAECKKWIKTIYEIFEKDESKINTLQEFFGLCLTRETMY